MGNSSLEPNPSFKIKDFYYLSTERTEHSGLISVYRSRTCPITLKFVKHLKYPSELKRTDPLISKIEKLSSEIAEYKYFFKLD